MKENAGGGAFEQDWGAARRRSAEADEGDEVRRGEWDGRGGRYRGGRLQRTPNLQRIQ